MAWANVSFNVAVDGDCACCGGTPSACGCYLYLPAEDFGNPFPNYAAANDAIQNNATCYLYPILLTGNTPTRDNSSTTITPNSLVVTVGVSGGGGARLWTAVNLPSGAEVSVNISHSSGSSANVGLVSNCTYYSVQQNFDEPVFPYSFIAPSENVYYFGGGVTPVSSPGVFTFELTCNVNIVPNPVIAFWDDSGTTRQLEACPRLLLPSSTESSGNWFADETEASDFMANFITDCLFLGPKTGGVTGYTAVYSNTASGVDVEADFSGAEGDANAGGAIFSVNAEVGENVTLSWTGSTDGDPLTGIVEVDDYAGNTVFSDMSTTSPITVGPFTFPGRYKITGVVVTSGASNFSIDASVSVSGAVTKNPAQALYDIGLSCPARLECT
jgi:hypothetical protein